MAGPPFDAAAPPADPDLRRAHVTGTPLWDGYQLVGGKYMWGQPGFQLLVTVRLENGDAVWVNEGWVPSDEVDLILLNERAIASPRTWQGLSRAWPEVEGARYGEHKWNAVSPLAMAEVAGVRAPSFVLYEGEGLAPDADIPDRTPPIGGWRLEPQLRPHTEYALTWFSLSATLLIVWCTASLRKEGAED